MYVVGLGGRGAGLEPGAYSGTVASHDSAAVLVHDGRVIAAVEEERLNRVKHTNVRPAEGVRFCLEQARLTPADIDVWAYPYNNLFYDMPLLQRYLRDPEYRGPTDGASMMAAWLSQELDAIIDPRRIEFVEHHLAHAVSAFELSGMRSALVITWDGGGDNDHGRVYDVGEDGEYKLVHAMKHPLGRLYLDVTNVLGYELFDEYKVMGLAPYGNADRFRDLVRALYQLNDDGTFELMLDRVPILFSAVTPRRKRDPFTQDHKDLAAAVQVCLEEICFHVITAFRDRTGQERLCLSGGVALNATFNGKLTARKLFREVFVQPAAHDAGASWGAALQVCVSRGATRPRERLQHVFLGPHCGTDDEIAAELRRWQTCLRVEEPSDIFEAAADRLARGEVLGWVQGRSEFGPRALGHRSIVADPRPAENKARINAMVKQREAYRPFAPAVLADAAEEYFDVESSNRSLDFMVVVADVVARHRELLGATTHVDGSARVQLVREDDNPAFWKLISMFGRRTGVPILLNTSFNNNVEPIVQTARDAIVCFLTTGLDALAIGRFLVTKTMQGRVVSTDWLASVPARHRLVRESRPGHCDAFGIVGQSLASRIAISREVYDVLLRCDGQRTIDDAAGGNSTDAILDEMTQLWYRRAVDLVPG